MLERLKIYRSPEDAGGDNTDSNNGDTGKPDILTGEADKLTPEQIKELQQGHMRLSDYTRKMQELKKQTESIKQFKGVIELAKTDPDEAIEAFREMIEAAGDRSDNDSHSQEKEKKGAKDVVSDPHKAVKDLNRRVAEIQVTMEINELKQNPVYGSVFKKHEESILDLAVQKNLKLDDAVVIWCSQHPKEFEASRLQRGEHIQHSEPNRSVVGPSNVNMREYVKSGDITGGFKAYQKGKG